uniref:Uncharacterized protein n=2 Tax=Ditylum brightwellii TaxID=49249 RepID=A0A6V2AY19_9STRA|mmetsp:Transcript_24159/g.32169  ORF Transcript_24159/g.32169 Transcript_24159/m.32169 type:complete len:863 (-) Transcript_24159:344-2932(-)
MSSSAMPSLLMQAAQSAALADGVVPPSGTPTPSSQGNEQDAVAAVALAMVAAGNGNNARAIGSSAPAPAGQLERARSALMAAQKAATEAKQRASIKTDENTNGVPGQLNTAPSPAAIAAAMARSVQLSGVSAPAPSPSAGSAAHMLATAAAAAPSAPSPNPSPAAPTPQAAPSPSPAPPPSSGGGGGKKKGPPLRRGKWTAEEEAYANRLILEFKAGLLPLTDGTTLRTFLSKLLNCDPMRISKKFVGSNCIGKQVFRRRTADINRLTPDQIQQSRAELSELERRFLERVAQTNRVKSSSVGGGGGGGGASGSGNSASASAATSSSSRVKSEEQDQGRGGSSPPSPPWLRPPTGYKPGTGAAAASAALAGGTNNRAAAAGRALLQGAGGSNNAKSTQDQKSTKTGAGPGNNTDSAGLLAMAELQRRNSQNNMLKNAAVGLMSANGTSGNNLLAAAAAPGPSGATAGLSGPAMAQIARNASAARIAGMAAAGNSMNNLMLKTGLSREQLSQIARDQQLASSTSLSNMMERQSSFDALMSLDFQSLQSIDNLANLIQTGGGGNGFPGQQVPRSGMKNWSMESNNKNAAQFGGTGSSSNNLSANARRLASAGRMESLIRSLSSGNVANRDTGSGGGSNANFGNLLQSMQSNLGGAGQSANSLFGSGNAASALNLANMLRTDSSTGLTALRMQDGLAQRNTSVDDFLSLVASGDIPHQDPHMLNVPLQSVLQQQQAASQGGNQSGAQAAATQLLQQQLIAQAANGGNNALSNALAQAGSLGNFGNNSAASLLNQLVASQGGSADTNGMAAALAQQQQQARAAQINRSASAFAAARAAQNGSSSDLKRKFSALGSSSGLNSQGLSKR